MDTYFFVGILSFAFGILAGIGLALFLANVSVKKEQKMKNYKEHIEIGERLILVDGELYTPDGDLFVPDEDEKDKQIVVNVIVPKDEDEDK